MRESRLQFTDKERLDPVMGKAAQKAEKAADKAEKAKAKTTITHNAGFSFCINAFITDKNLIS